MTYVPDKRFKLILDPDELRQTLLADLCLMREPLFSVDTETTYKSKEFIQGLRIKNHDWPIVTRRIKGNPNNFPFMFTFSTNEENGYAILTDAKFIPVLTEFLENPKYAKILHNAKYDFHMMMNLGIMPQGKIWDTHIMIHLINEEEQQVDETGNPKFNVKGEPVVSKALKELARKYIGLDSDKFEILVDEQRAQIAKSTGRKNDEVGYNEVSLDIMVDYACADTLYTITLFKKFLPRLIEQDLMSIYEIEESNIFVLTDIERTGHRVDKTKLESVYQTIQANVFRLENEIYGLVGKAFNINSAEEMVEAFRSLGVEWQFFTDKKEYETSESALTHYKEGHYSNEITTLATKLLEHRSDSKMANTFIKGILDNTDPDDERVRGNYNQALTVTGRLSMSEPNLQNQDKKDKRARECFIPTSDEWVLVYHDAEQEEYRLLAHYAKCVGLINMIKKGYDVHKATGAMMFNVAYEEVTKEMRDKGKTTNFALVYGLGDPAFAKALGEPIDEKLYYKGMWGIPQAKGLKPWDILRWEEGKLQRQLNEWMDKNRIDQETADAIKYYWSPEVRKMIQHAKDVKNEYFRKLPEIKDFLDVCKRRAEERGYIFTWAKRRRHFSNPKRQAYKSPNSLIQGGCADILKVNLARVHRFLQPYRSRIVNNIHDEIQVEYHITELWLVPLVDKLLCKISEHFTVPIDWGLEYTTVSWAVKGEADETLKGMIADARENSRGNYQTAEKAMLSA